MGSGSGFFGAGLFLDVLIVNLVLDALNQCISAVVGA